MKKIIAFIFGLVLLLGIVPFSIAQENVAVKEENKEEVLVNISSFELFWPISAGKTIDDSFYWLKNIKEDLRGLLIFGKLQKADYATFLTIKRIVESEKLINENKTDLADKTLQKANKQLEIAEISIDKTLSYGGGLTGLDVMHDRLLKLEIFIPKLLEIAGGNKGLLEETLVKVQSLLEKF